MYVCMYEYKTVAPTFRTWISLTAFGDNCAEQGKRCACQYIQKFVVGAVGNLTCQIKQR
eukprot:m.54442 g.54442  ORF g.54442 m.54442 type:complete len:59 (-) comp15510_c0_seq4:1955-2131(-)